MSSIFTRIIAGEIPSYKVAEDENYYAFLDINPLTKGHTLVVPKMEVDYIFDLDDRTLAGMMLFAKEVAAKIKREIACARVAVVVLGLEVPHAHIHLIPIQSENDVDFHREKLKLTPEEFREIAEKIKQDIAFDWNANPNKIYMPEEKRNAYINEGGIHHLDKEYTVFGEVIEGFEVIDKIAALPTDGNDRPITDVRIKVRILSE